MSGERKGNYKFRFSIEFLHPCDARSLRCLHFLTCSEDRNKQRRGREKQRRGQGSRPWARSLQPPARCSGEASPRDRAMWLPWALLLLCVPGEREIFSGRSG